MNNLGTITLETERLILRKFKIEDAEEMYNTWATDKDTNKYLPWELHKSIDETKEIIQKWIDEYENNSYNWVVELKSTHKIIGSISVVKMKKEYLNCEVGYCYGSKHWGKGYATEALKKVIDYLLNKCEFHLVEAYHMSDNIASGKVMEKAGMKKEAVLKDRVINKHTKKLNDYIIYSIIK